MDPFRYSHRGKFVRDSIEVYTCGRWLSRGLRGNRDNCEYQRMTFEIQGRREALGLLVLLGYHLQPINLVVFKEPYGIIP